MPNQPDTVITYAQNKEDLLIAGFFSDVKKGFYVDVGAHHPTKDSVTKYFYQQGWHGINIEPQKRLFELLKKSRPKDINLNVGVSNKSGTLEFREYPGGGLSTFSSEIKKSYEQNDVLHGVEHKDYKVKVETLGDLLKKHVGSKQRIHFCKIDVEGLEYEVIEGNDWSKYRPELICIESNHIVHDWHKLLEKAKYTKVLADGLNEYFLANESMHRKEQFDYPQQFLSGQRVVDWETDKELAAAARMESNYSRLEASLATTKRKNKELREQNKLLTKQRYRTLHHLKWLPVAIAHDIKRLLKGGRL